MDPGFVKGQLDNLPKIDSTVMALSFIKNKYFVIAEIRGLGCLHTKLGVNVVPQVESKVHQAKEIRPKSSDMESLSSTLSVSNASATGSGRSKVALKPGHSLMDWIKYTHSGQDLTSTGGKCIEVSPRELAKHNTKRDAWIALKGKVYNITPYLDYHPGGEEELMRGAGKDATDLFNQVHRWVNAESMLQKCFVGVLKKPWSLDVPRLLPLIKPLKKQKHPKIIPESSLLISSKSETEIPTVNGMSEWRVVSPTSSVSGELSLRFSDEGSKTRLKIIASNIRYQELITDLIRENLFVKLNKDSLIQWLNISLLSVMKENYEVKVTESEGEENILEILLFEDKNSMYEGSKNVMWTLSSRDTENIFWPCKLVKKSAVNYNTYLFTFLLPSNVKMWVPIGYHVFVKSDIEGMEIVRSYTPVVSLDTCEQNDPYDGSHITLMIKIYPSGTLTPLINFCSIGESIFMSNYTGSFTMTLLEKCDSIVMLAAGTGITPMIKVIVWALTAKDKKRSLLLLFFNKTEEDILWKAELENCSNQWENFQVIYILSESNHKWNGFTGAISEDILSKTLPTKPSSNQQILICGPLPFTNYALRLFENAGYNQEYVHAFTE